jgi:hypothetical protein
MTADETPTTEQTTSPTTTPTGVVTREQARRETEERNATDDAEQSRNGNTRKKEKEKEIFQGKVPGMHGNVFLLAEEGGRKGNQYTTTLDALRAYANLHLEHAKDLKPFFATPSEEVIIPEPPDEPPGPAKQNRDHRLYIVWRCECETYNARTAALYAQSFSNSAAPASNPSWIPPSATKPRKKTTT